MSCYKKDATAYHTLLARSIGSLVIAFKSIGKEYFRTTPCCYFTLHTHKKILNKNYIFSNSYCGIYIETPTSTGGNVASASHILGSSIFQLLIIWNYTLQCFNFTTYIPNFFQIRLLWTSNLDGGKSWASRARRCTAEESGRSYLLTYLLHGAEFFLRS
jgi:hypothetical protein